MSNPEVFKLEFDKYLFPILNLEIGDTFGTVRNKFNNVQLSFAMELHLTENFNHQKGLHKDLAILMQFCAVAKMLIQAD